jgi:hypothetical protein
MKKYLLVLVSVLLIFHYSIVEAIDLSKSWSVNLGIDRFDLVGSSEEIKRPTVNPKFSLGHLFLYKKVDKESLKKIGFEYRFYHITGEPYYDRNTGEVGGVFTSSEDYYFKDGNFSTKCHLLSLRADYKIFTFRLGYNFWNEELRETSPHIDWWRGEVVPPIDIKKKGSSFSYGIGIAPDISLFKGFPKISLTAQLENLKSKPVKLSKLLRNIGGGMALGAAVSISCAVLRIRLTWIPVKDEEELEEACWELFPSLVWVGGIGGAIGPTLINSYIGGSLGIGVSF